MFYITLEDYPEGGQETRLTPMLGGSWMRDTLRIDHWSGLRVMEYSETIFTRDMLSLLYQYNTERTEFFIEALNGLTRLDLEGLQVEYPDA